ncbi:MAG TPA: hypothetical protein VFO58_09610, partial [Vicinamibacterales bacterium]|nr:hypothetical protein [Vicinamibacterales bacterium]
GESAADILSCVLQREPDWTRLPSSVPPAVRQLLRLCLEKDPRKRRQSAGDVRIDLDQALSGPSAGAPAPPVRRSRVARLAWIGGSVVVIAALAIPAAMHFLELAPPEIRLQIVTPATQQPLSFALSPDGRYIVFVVSGSTAGDPDRLYLRPLDRTEGTVLPHTEGARLPFWSPDSRSVGFFASERLHRIDIAGGPAQPLAPASNPRGGSWGTDGTILFAPNTVSPLLRVPASGGTAAVAATTLDATRQTSHSQPSFLPDGRRFLFYGASSDPDVSGLYLGSRDGHPPKRLIAATQGAFLAPDTLVLVQQEDLIARRFDPTQGVLSGDPVTLATSVGAFSVSSTGIIAHRAAGGAQLPTNWFDRTGAAQNSLGVWFNGPELSPDGQRLIGDRTIDGNRDVWEVNLARGGLRRMTTDPGIDGYPLWSPDGEQIAFHSNRKGTIDLWITPSNRPGAEQPLLEGPDSEWAIDWSKDGRYLLYQRADLKDRWDLWALPMTGTDRTPFAVASTSSLERLGEFSPDTRWIAYDTNESGRPEIVVQAFPVAKERIAVSTAGGTAPRWSADGRKIYFTAPDAMMMAVPVEPKGSTLMPGRPAPLFPTRITGQTFKHQYAVSSDGRFLINNAAESSAPPITVILNAKPF